MVIEEFLIQGRLQNSDSNADLSDLRLYDFMQALHCLPFEE